MNDPRCLSNMEPNPAPSSSRREGFALAVAMIAIVVIGALIAGAFFTSTQEYRVGRNSLTDQRAFAAAEAGATQPIQGWVKRVNLSMADGATTAPDTLRLPSTGDAYSVRRMTRLDKNTFWVMSDGYAGGSNGQAQAQHRINAVYRLTYPKFNILGALTARGMVTVQGSSAIDGNDYIPPGWTGGICPATGPAVPGVAAPDTTMVCSGPTCPGDDGKNRLVGDPPESQNPAAADTNTYYKYGDTNWQLLVENADIAFTGSGTYTLNTQPAISGTACNYSLTTNWGDPERLGACADYFPIIYIDGNLKVQSNSRGQGVLLVNGSLDMAGGFVFNGIVVVRNDINSTGTGNKITGGAFAGDTYTTDNSGVLGNAEIHYSSCAIDRASRGSSTVVRMKQRAFNEIIQ